MVRISPLGRNYLSHQRGGSPVEEPTVINTRRRCFMSCEMAPVDHEATCARSVALNVAVKNVLFIPSFSMHKQNTCLLQVKKRTH